MKRYTILIILLLAFSALTVFAQPKPIQRTKEFDKLNVFVGKWHSEGKIHPGEGRPTIAIKRESSFEWVMRKTWLMHETAKGRMQGHGYMTWDKELGKYFFLVR